MKSEVRSHEVRSSNELPGLPYVWMETVKPGSKIFPAHKC